MFHGGYSVSHCKIAALTDQISENKVGLSCPNRTSGAWQGFRKATSSETATTII
jgi:hypothetical protein